MGGCIYQDMRHIKLSSALQHVCSGALVLIAAGFVGGCPDNPAKKLKRDKTQSKKDNKKPQALTLEEKLALAEQLNPGSISAETRRRALSKRAAGASSKRGRPKRPSGTTLTDASKTKKCRSEVTAGLKKFRDDLGLAIKVTNAHVGSLFATGVVAIPYARDGIRHTPSFRFESRGACHLTFFKRARKSPGRSTATQATYGIVKLTACVCN